MKVSKKRKKFLSKTYRMFKSGDNCYSIIEVYLDNAGKIVNYTDYVIPTGTSINALKFKLSWMLQATRNYVLTEEDLKCIK